jgi:hypothetical protein
MTRYLAILLVLSIPQLASAESVQFGAKLDNGGGHASGSATANGMEVTGGRMSWGPKGVTIESGWIFQGNIAALEGTITRSNDKAWLGRKVTILAYNTYVKVEVWDGSSVIGTYEGYGHVTFR